jgi:hypothetical protein
MVAPNATGAATIELRDVALPALRHTTDGDRSVLGLPSLIDHLFDLPALPDIPRG